jgi:proline iminopeptidase
MPNVISEFSAERPVYFYDQLGGGKSDAAEDPDYYSVDHFVQELEEVRNKLNLTNVILFGHSWGGGLVCAYMLDKKPEGVESLILESPYLSTPYFCNDIKENLSRLPESVVRTFEKCEENGDYGQEFYMAYIEYMKNYMCLMNPLPDVLKGAMQQLMGSNVYSTLWGNSELSINGKLESFDLYPQLNEIAVPVLLISGDRDEVGVKTIKDYQLAFCNAQMAVIPRASHMNHLEKPELFKAIVRDFLTENKIQ